MTASTAASPAVSQLAAWWQGQNEATKLIFNQLYREVPDVVLRVLTQGQLTPDPAHTSIDEIVSPAGAGAVFAQPRVEIMAVTVQPQYPKANEDFAVTYERSATGALPDHSDVVQILDLQGSPVDERPLGRGATAGPTRETVTETFQGLPTGTYRIIVWGNLEGSDGTGVPTAQGMRGYNGVELYVGDTREAQRAQTVEPAGIATGQLFTAQYAVGQIAQLWDGASLDQAQLAEWDEQFRTALATAATALRDVPSLGQGFDQELYRISAMLNRPPAWRRLAEEGQLMELTQRLTGVASINAVESPGDVGFALIDIVDKLYD